MLVALFLSSFIFIMPWVFRELRANRSVLGVYWFVICLHQLVAFINAFGFTTFGAAKDALTFHRSGVEQALSGNFTFGLGSEFYKVFLAVIYDVFGSSHFLGEQLSVLAFALSCVLLLKISQILGLLRYRASSLFLFGALPTMVLLGSVTLRESFQVMFFMLAVYFAIKMHMRGGINKYLFALIIASFCMGLFHKGLLVYAFFIIVFFMVWTLYPTTRLVHVKKLRLMSFCFIPLLMVGVFVLSQVGVAGLGALTSIAEMKPLEAAASYREHSTDARATYGVSLDLSSPLTAMYSSSLLYVNYLFAPFLWQVGNIPDVYAFLESMLRLILILFAMKGWGRAQGSQKRLYGMMLMLYFSITLLWAMGTTNYGTAMRHHMLDWWIIVIIGWPVLFDAIRKQLAILIHHDKLNIHRE